MHPGLSKVFSAYPVQLPTCIFRIEERSASFQNQSFFSQCFDSFTARA
jgi:hypothetical protein